MPLFNYYNIKIMQQLKSVLSSPNCGLISEELATSTKHWQFWYKAQNKMLLKIRKIMMICCGRQHKMS
jgi:hypothetical protein